MTLALMLATVKIAEGEVSTVYAPPQPLKLNDHFFSQENAPMFASNKTSLQGASSPNTYQLYAQATYGHIPYLVETLKRESGYESIQSRVIRADGTRERSYGCAQIYEPAHPDVTREQAMDCIWSIDWTAQQFLKGKACLWTEYRKITGQTAENCKPYAN